MRLRSLVLVCCAFALASCGGSKPKSPPFQWDGSLGDGGDAGSPGGDASTVIDAGPVLCTATTMTLLADATGSNLDLALAGGAQGFLAVWTQKRNGTPGVYARYVPSTGSADVEQKVNYVSGGTMQHPAVTSSPGGFIASYADNTSVTGFDIYSVGFLPGGGIATAALQTSNSSGVGDDFPVLAYNAGGALAVWNQTSGATTTLLHSIVPDSVAPMATPAPLTTPGNPVGKLALATLGSDTYMLGYVGGDGTLKGQLLDSTSAPTGGEVPISGGAVGGSFDFAGAQVTDANAQVLGAAVWDVNIVGNHQVHIERFEKGTITTPTPELNLNTTDHGQSPSIAAVAGGYVVAMRATVGGVTKLRVLFIDHFATNILDSKDYDTLVNPDGLVQVRVDATGRILVVWSDDVANGANLHALRLDCTGA